MENRIDCRRIKDLLDNDIKVLRDRLEVARLDSSEEEVNKQE